MKLVVFEDDQFDRFLPLAWVRAVFELKSGATTLAEKITRAAGTQIDALITRDYLVPTLERRWDSAAVNNLVLGCTVAVHRGTVRYAANNFTDRGRGAQPLPGPPPFAASTPLDYRLRVEAELETLGVADAHSDRVRHDFYGLLRRGERRAAGAFRTEPGAPTDSPRIEIELTTGEVVVR